jgi:hypothetical protein
MLQSKYNKTDHKAHLISSANSYMFRHLGAIIKEVRVQPVFQVLFTLNSNTKVKSLKMLKLRITHQVYVHISNLWYCTCKW